MLPAVSMSTANTRPFEVPMSTCARDQESHAAKFGAKGSFAAARECSWRKLRGSSAVMLWGKMEVWRRVSEDGSSRASALDDDDWRKAIARRAPWTDWTSTTWVMVPEMWFVSAAKSKLQIGCKSCASNTLRADPEANQPHVPDEENPPSSFPGRCLEPHQPANDPKFKAAIGEN
jgi:hypothetical protein